MKDDLELDTFSTGPRGIMDKFSADFVGFHGALNRFFNAVLRRKDIVKRVGEKLYLDPETGEFQPEEKLYLRRWFIAGYGSLFSKITGRHIFLHCIKRIDDDRHMHDHPWDFNSLILWGGYQEQLPWWMDVKIGPGLTLRVPKLEAEGAMSRRASPGSFMRNLATHIHRINILPKGCAWTLVITSGKHRKWGFWVDDEQGKPPYWVYWREYLGVQGYDTTENIGDD